MNKTIQKIGAGLSTAAITLSILAMPAFAALSHSLFGDAAVVSGGNSGQAVRLRSDANNGAGYGGIDIDAPSDLTFADLTTLSADYNVTDDDCGGGSPRFQINVDTNNDGTSDGNVFAYLGPSPSFTDCETGWQSSGNLIGNDDAGRFDFTQLGGPLGTYSDAPTAVMNGTILGIQLVVDSSWSSAATGGDSEQTILADNVRVNSETITFDPTAPGNKEQCKKGGYMNMVDGDGRPFKNQGQCVSYFNHNR